MWIKIYGETKTVNRVLFTFFICCRMRPFPRPDPTQLQNYVNYVQQCINEWIFVCLLVFCFQFFSASERARHTTNDVHTISVQFAFFRRDSFPLFFVRFQFHIRTSSSKLRILMRTSSVGCVGCICLLPASLCTATASCNVGYVFIGSNG